MYVTTVMVVLLIAWCGFTILTKPETHRLPPAPVTRNMTFSDDAVGWMPRLIPNYLRKAPAEKSPALNQELNATNTSSSGGTTTDSVPHYSLVPNAGALLGLIGILMAFGHSFLAMSGEESLAQVNRELEYPKHKNLMKAGLVIFLYSLLFTSLVSFFAYALIPDDVNPQEMELQNEGESGDQSFLKRSIIALVRLLLIALWASRSLVPELGAMRGFLSSLIIYAAVFLWGTMFGLFFADLTSDRTFLAESESSPRRVKTQPIPHFNECGLTPVEIVR